jgi:hypothetical protein
VILDFGLEKNMTIRTWEDAQAAMEIYAQQAAELATHLGCLDAALAKVRATYQRHTELTTAELAEMETVLEKFAAEHKVEFKAAPDGDGRSYEHAGVSIGFRKLPDKVGLPRGEAKKQVSLEYLAQYRPEFVRRTPEFDLLALLPALKEGPLEQIKALAEHDITLRPGKDQFFLKVKTEG